MHALALADFSESLKVYQPLMQLVQVIAVLLLTGMVGLFRLREMIKQRHLDEAKARREGIDPEHAEATGYDSRDQA